MGSPAHRLRCCASIFAPRALPAALLLLLLSLLLSRLPVSRAQNASEACNGIFLSYDHSSRAAIRPRNVTPQPYSFRATATISNFDSVPLKSWAFHVGLPNGTILVSLSNSVLTDGSPLPAVTAIETAGDLTQMQVIIAIVGTQFGAEYMPRSLSLGSRKDYICPAATSPPAFRSNDSSPLDTEFLPRSEGDITISYDVTQSHSSNYLALVTIANGSPLGRLDNWRLTWQWMRGEFISTARGAYTSTVGSSECVFGPQGSSTRTWTSPRWSTARGRPPSSTCRCPGPTTPTWGGSPSAAATGPSCRRSWTPADAPRPEPDRVLPPQNWRITGAPGALNPSYECSPPVRVSPAQFPDSSGLQSSTSAIASWQVVCNITRPRGSNPRCCVSFSAFYNESAVPCKTCACGCPSSSSSAACSATSPALLLPSEALLVPFENRTTMARAWAELKHFGVPNPIPCGDFCGVSINWHISTDYRNGWSARMTLFNWEDASLPDWFAAVRLNEAAYPGYEAMYSFNGTAVGNNTIFIEGLSGLNYLMGETAGENSEKDPRMPGKQQSVISFTKKATPEFDMLKGHGFPTKVIFNGEECSLPDFFPANWGHRTAMVDRVWSLVILLAVTLKILLDQ
ncbi:unnamed protein product [Spirodela intermedia]|uniref:COBRA C-terminal domain-containing protein n=1 Tax=Spirodela intermedia TaxID=51605 RepID=A0A7I8I9U1_SPIIN|nr:unnamed protein product [Spirodela intermedia]CAA6654360.1 unnamed protein product [Spirodela intermedia]